MGRPLVGIMSMQRIRNYGSFLQAYGLRRMLASLGCDVRFVDYRLGGCLVEPERGSRLPRPAAKLAEVMEGPGAACREARLRQLQAALRRAHLAAAGAFRGAGLPHRRPRHARHRLGRGCSTACRRTPTSGTAPTCSARTRGPGAQSPTPPPAETRLWRSSALTASAERSPAG